MFFQRGRFQPPASPIPNIASPRIHGKIADHRTADRIRPGSRKKIEVRVIIAWRTGQFRIRIMNLDDFIDQLTGFFFADLLLRFIYRIGNANGEHQKNGKEINDDCFINSLSVICS